MEKPLVHSSPSSALILLPAASTSTDAANAPGNRRKALSPRTPLLPKGYLRVAGTSTLGFCNPCSSSAGLVVM
jgi:hypothetical protein